MSKDRHAAKGQTRFILCTVAIVLSIAPVAAKKNEGAFTHRRIFQHDSVLQAGARYYNHSPSLESLPDGQLVVAWSTGEIEGSTDNRILVSRSADGGGSWSSPSAVFDYDGDYLARDPLLFYHAQRLWMMFRLQKGSGSGNNSQVIDGYLSSSTDGGESWSAPHLIETGKSRPITPLHKPSVLSDGRLAFAFYWRNSGENQMHTGVLLGNSELTSWETRGDIFITGRRVLEPVLTVEPSGQMFLFFRTDLDYLFRSESKDEGQTWTPPIPLPVPNPDSLADVRRLEDGRYVVAWNNRPDARDYLALGIFESADLTDLTRVVVVEKKSNRFQSLSYPHLLVRSNKVMLAYSVLQDIQIPVRHGDIWFAQYTLSKLPKPGGARLSNGNSGASHFE